MLRNVILIEAWLNKKRVPKEIWTKEVLIMGRVSTRQLELMKKYTLYLSIFLFHSTIVAAGNINSCHLEGSNTIVQTISWTLIPPAEMEFTPIGGSSRNTGMEENRAPANYETLTIGNSLYGAVLIILYSTFYGLFLLKLWPVRGRNK